MLPLDEALTFTAEKADELLLLDEALDKLSKVDPRKSRAVELRFFGGLSIEEISNVMNISVATVGRELRMAEAWLYRETAQA
jgi:RNA polymerase sigma factor (sigma-70 family)